MARICRTYRALWVTGSDATTSPGIEVTLNKKLFTKPAASTTKGSISSAEEKNGKLSPLCVLPRFSKLSMMQNFSGCTEGLKGIKKMKETFKNTLTESPRSKTDQKGASGGSLKNAKCTAVKCAAQTCYLNVILRLVQRVVPCLLAIRLMTEAMIVCLPSEFRNKLLFKVLDEFK